MDFFLVGGDSPCFLRGERQIAEALVGAVSASRQSRVIGINGAQGVAIAGEIEFYCGQSVSGAQEIDFALADALEPFQRGVTPLAASF